MAHLTISLFGGVSVKLDGQPVNSFESNKARALLAYLVTEADRAHSREKLAALLWPDMPDQAARNNLRYTLSNLRKVIGDLHAAQPFLSVSQQTIQLNLLPDLEVDVLTFNQRLARSPLTVADLEEAIRVYRGDFLEGFSISDDATFEEWAVLKREQLRRQALDALHRLAQAYEKAGDINSAVSVGWRWVDLEPWSEEAHRHLMRLLGLNGQRSAALTQYETCRRVLAEELNVEPSLETVRLYEQIRDGEIKPLGRTQGSVVRSAEKDSGREAEPRSSIAGSILPKLDKRVIRRLKIIGIGLIVVLVSGALIFFLKSSTATYPVTTSVKGKIVGTCLEQGRPRFCITDAQTGRIIQVIDNLPVDHLGPGLSWAPDGKQIVFAASTKPRQGVDDYDLYVINADGTNLQQITTGDDNDILPDWSPDGAWVAFHRNCVLWIIRPDGTQGKPLSFGLCAVGIAWSPDSQWIAFLDASPPDGQRPATIRVYQQGGSDSRIVYSFDQPVKHGDLAWSPDGQQIFCRYDAGGDTKTTTLIDANGRGALKQGVEIPVSWFQDFSPQWESKK
jgi:DNA-binding SARP family transcriptional activator